MNATADCQDSWIHGEGGVVINVQELDRLTTAGADVGQKSRGDRMVLMVQGAEMCFFHFMCCLLLDRKSVVHLQVESDRKSVVDVIRFSD